MTPVSGTDPRRQRFVAPALPFTPDRRLAGPVPA